MTNEKKCKFCSQPFTSTIKTKIYCSKKCNGKAYEYKECQ